MGRKLKGGVFECSKKAEIGIPHKGEIITFKNTLIGPGSYEGVVERIKSRELRMPTTDETISLLWAAYQNSSFPYFQRILKGFGVGHLWTSTRSMSFPRGVIVYDDVNGEMPATSDGLIKLLESGDPRTRLVEEDLPDGRMPIEKVLNHPYTLAQIQADTIPILREILTNLNETQAVLYGAKKSPFDLIKNTVLFRCPRETGFNREFNLHSTSKDLGYAVAIVPKAA